MGFLDALGMAAVPAANVLAARNEGQIAAQQRGLQNAMALYQMRRQADNDQVNALYRASLGNAANARAENSRDPMISVTPTQTGEGSVGPSLANRVRASSLNAPLAPPAPPQQPQQAGATPEDPATSMAPGAEFPGGQVPAGALPTKLYKIGTQPKPAAQPTRPLYGSPEWQQAFTTEMKLRQQFAPPPATTISIQPGADGGPAQGVVTTSRDPKQLGKTTAIPGITKQVGGLGQRGPAMQIGQAQMENADNAMTPYDQALSNGSVNLTGLDAFQGKVGQAFLKDDPADVAIQTTALAHLNSVNPDLARYLRRGLEFAQGESQFSGRPSDFRTKLSDFLSTAGPNPSPGMLADIMNTRSTIVKAGRKAIGGTAVPYTPDPANVLGSGRGSAGAGQVSAERAAWNAAVAKYGRDAVIKAGGVEPPE